MLVNFLYVDWIYLERALQDIYELYLRHQYEILEIYRINPVNTKLQVEPSPSSVDLSNEIECPLLFSVLRTLILFGLLAVVINFVKLLVKDPYICHIRIAVPNTTPSGRA